MSNPIIADNKPKKVELTAGTDYYFCTCGRSKNQPFCDGSHIGSDFSPQQFSVEQDQVAYLCCCKHSSNQPFCDGSHQQFSASDIGTTAEETSIPVTEPESIKVTNTVEEPTVEFIHQLAKEGLTKMGHHGRMTSMGVPRNLLPHWDDIQIMVAQMATKPLFEDTKVATDLVIGPRAKRPLTLTMPLFVSDMSFGSLSEEAKIALAKGAELAGTGICSGEGGMLPEEQAANSRYFYELASGQFGYDEQNITKVQAFHFKGGQGAKTGTGGHLPGIKNIGKIAQVRGLTAGTDAISPPTFTNLHSAADFKQFADHIRAITQGIPIGFKLSANHIEQDIQFALDASADYIILDGRGGGTGAAPEIFRDHISVPTIPALARARAYLDQVGATDVTLIVTGGLRVPMDFVKAMAMGADGIAVSNSAMQAIGCIAARICHTNNCPAGITTQKPELRQKLQIDQAANQLRNFFESSCELMKVMARACGHDHLNQFNPQDLATWSKEMSELSGIKFSGIDR